MNHTFEQYRDMWAQKTTKQIEKEIASLHRYMNKHNAAYHWHGSKMRAPGEMSDGDRMRALKDALVMRQVKP
jgi:hypothetical protein